MMTTKLTEGSHSTHELHGLSQELFQFVLYYLYNNELPSNASNHLQDLIVLANEYLLIGNLNKYLKSDQQFLCKDKAIACNCFIFT